jgi:hypothetical protein
VLVDQQWADVEFGEVVGQPGQPGDGAGSGVEVARGLASRGAVRTGRGRSALFGGADGQVADLDVVGLLDGEGDGSRHGFRADSERVHRLLCLRSLFRVLDVVDEFGRRAG